MRKLRRETPWNDPDPLLPNRVLTVLWDLLMRAQIRLEWLDTLRAFRGTQDPYRKALYSGVLRVWTEVLNGQIAIFPEPARGADRSAGSISYRLRRADLRRRDAARGRCRHHRPRA